MTSRAFAAMAALFAAFPFATATAGDVELTVLRKRLDDDKTTKSGIAHYEDSNDTESFVMKQRKQKVAYIFTLTNRSFQDKAPLTVKYMIFYKDEQPGSNAAPVEKSIAGSVMSTALTRNGGKSVVETKPVTLESAEMPPGVSYASGAKKKSQDKISGIWVRVYDEAGALVVDLPNPTSLKQKHEWKE